MRKLLDKTTQRFIQIIEILVENGDWLTIKDISVLTYSSERTIANDISVIRKRWGTYLNIEISSKNGFRIVNPNISKMGNVITDLLNESTILQLLEAIFLYPKNKIEYYEKKLYVSRSTLLRLIPIINSFLAEKEIWIQNQDNRYELRGNNEQYLRQFFTCFLIELHSVKFNDELQDFNLLLIAHVFNNIVKKNILSEEQDYILDDNISISYNMMFYTTSLVRENGGYCIASNHLIDSEISTKTFEHIKKYFPNIERENLKPIHEQIINMYIGWDSKAEEEKIKKATHLFYQRIFDSMQVTPDDKILKKLNFLMKNIYFVTKFRPYPTSDFFDRIHYFSLSLKKNNKTYYHLVKQNLNMFSQDVNYDMSARLADILFWMCLYYPELSKISIYKTAVVISDFGKQHAEFLTHFFNSFFNNKHTIIKISTLEFTNITDFPLNQYDFLITTIPDLPVEHKNIIVVNDYPSTENLFEIHKLIFGR